MPRENNSIEKALVMQGEVGLDRMREIMGAAREFNNATWKKALPPDDLNPEIMFSGTATQLLVDGVNRRIDLEAIASKELANRGLDLQGNWVGFEKANQIHEDFLENNI